MCFILHGPQAYLLSLPTETSPQLYLAWLRTVCSSLDCEGRAQHLLVFPDLFRAGRGRAIALITAGVR